MSYYFPPLGGIGSLRALRYARHLREFGWQPAVLTAATNIYPVDPGLVTPPIKILRALTIEPRSRHRKRSDETHTRPVPDRPSISRVLRTWVHRWLLRPDAQIGWYPFALNEGRHLLRDVKFDAVVSSSYPITAHRVARRLAGEHSLPWVAEFRDLWFEFNGHSGWRRRADLQEEEDILRCADAVVTVSDCYRRTLAGRGGRHVDVITNGFDPEDFEVQRPTRPIALHLGTLYPTIQDFETLARALARAVASEAALSDLQLLFVGTDPATVRSTIEANGLIARTHFTGFIDHHVALRHLAEARLLLLAGPTDVASAGLRGHLPAKVFEYLASQKPILAVAPEGSDLARLLGRFSGTAVVAPGDVPGAAAALTNLWMQRAARRTPSLEEFWSRRLTERLAATLDRVTC